jgi:amino-acid N-acetyltransferase
MIRKATIHDVRSIHALLQIYGSQGELLPRPLTRIYDHLRDFTVWVDEETDQVAGCCALQFCWEDLAEIRSLAVHPDRRNRRIGTLLTEWAITEAKIYHIQKVFTLTYRPGFFERFGFHRVDRADLPLKIWGDCLHCVKFPDCDEIAMMKILDADQE